MSRTLTFTKHYDYYVKGAKMFSYPPGVHENVLEAHANAAIEGGFATEGGSTSSKSGTTGGAASGTTGGTATGTGTGGTK